MSIKVTILGSNSAAPAHRRHHTAQYITIEGQCYLVDCGEGTQLQLKRYQLKAQRIKNIFISHLHGDHYLGLMGLLSTMHLMGRKTPLNLYGPKGLSDIITLQLKYSDTVFNYEVNYKVIDTEKHQLIHEDNQVEVYSIPLDHRIACSGFLFKEKTKKHRIVKEAIPENLEVSKIQTLKNGEDVLNEDGAVEMDHRHYTKPPRRSFSYAFCSDTKYNESIIPIIKGVDMLYHESTFLDEHMDRASNTYHSTAKEAATIAKKAEVGKLLLGHFSVRYKSLEPIEAEARTVFPESFIAEEGKDFLLHE